MHHKNLLYVLVIAALTYSTSSKADLSLYNRVVAIENNTGTDYDVHGDTVKARKVEKVQDGFELPLEVKPVDDESKPSFKIEKTETDYKAGSCAWYEAVRTYKVTSTAGQNKTFSVCVRKAKDTGLMIRIDKDYTAVVSHCYK
jgi:hypothetical protein